MSATKPQSLLVTGCCFLAAVSYCQAAPYRDYKKIAENTLQLKVSMRMDRSTYFPGEVCDVTIEVLNPTKKRLLVLEPFRVSTGRLDYLRKVGDKFKSSLVDPPFPNPLDASPPVVEFGPGEHRQLTMKSYDKELDFDSIRFLEGGALPEPGTYAVSYSYAAGAQAEFTVVAPKLEADVRVRLADMMYSDRPGAEEPHRIPTYVHVVALRYEERSYICVSQAIVALSNNIVPNGNGEFAGMYVGLAQLHNRVITSEASIVSLSATADPQENLNIAWTDATGAKHAFYHAASYLAGRGRR
jgi:hypothetical protein